MRAVLALPNGGWLIVDRADAHGEIRMDMGWHLHPAWTASPYADGFALLSTSGTTLALATTAPDRSIDAEAAHSPEYGRLEPAIALRTGLAGAGPLVVGSYVPGRLSAGPLPTIALVSGDDDDGPEWSACAFAIASDGAETRVRLSFPRSIKAQPAARWPQPCIQELRVLCVE
jgi:hypothetical protein